MIARARVFSAGHAFIAPAVLLLFLFFFGPLVAALVMSFTDFDIYALANLHNLRFIGLANYADLLTLPLFWRAFINTCYFAFVGAPLSIAVSLGAALLVNSPQLRFQALYRTAMFAPYVASLVATAVVWRYLLGSNGVINAALLGIGLPAVDWLGDARWSMPSIIIFAVWKNFGYNMLILLAALQAIPSELYDAARIDGAGPWSRLRHVTLPGIAPTLWLVALLTAASYFQMFAEPYVMTQGGPAQSTLSLLYFMYQDGFKWWNLGHASAAAFILFVIMAVLSLPRRHAGEHI